MLDCVADGRVGHGPLHNLVSSAQEIGWTWDFGLHAWSGLGLLGLCILDGPYQDWKLGWGRLLLTFAKRHGSGVVLCWTLMLLINNLSTRIFVNETKD